MNNSMSRILSILLITIFQISCLSGQNCLPGNTTFNDQSDIDNFSINYPGCTNIEGDLRIEPSSSGSITNLHGLSQLTSIGGDLLVLNSVEITDFTGLDNLTSIGGYFHTFGGVVSNSTTTSFNGLQNLQSVGGYLRLEGIYENLTTLDGLNNLNSVGSDISISLDPVKDISALGQITEVNGNLTFSWTDSLTNLNGLENLTSIDGNLVIIINRKLSNINGLSGLANVGGYVQIRNNRDLIDVDGLAALSTIGGNLDISLAQSLNSLTGLSNLTSMNGLLKIANTTLTTLDGLDNIDEAGITDLEIEYNTSLTTCEIESLCDYLDIPTSTASISNNQTNCNSVQEIQDACLVLLPVDLIDFNAKLSKSIVKLKWITANESNNKGFEVQQSNDGVVWQSLGFVEGRINSSQTTEYQFQDINPFRGLNYYRLKQVDFDEIFRYSNIVSVPFFKEKELQIFPNPTNGVFQIEGIENAEITILDNIGRTILEFEYTDAEINISDMPNGIYFIKTNSENTVSINKIIKE